MTKSIKVAVTGAAGQINYALLFRLASGQVFGLDTHIDLQLLEIPAALPALKGVVMELEDCAFPLLRNVRITDDPKHAFSDVNWAILVGAAPRRAGMERKDLLEKNASIFATQGKALNESAAADLRVLVVGNPCNTNCLIAMNHAPDVPKEHFYAMTRLDQDRACSQLALKADVNVSAIKNMVVWGNHSSTLYPDFYNASIDGQPLPQVITDNEWLMKEFIPLVQQRGALVINARGASSAASAANAIINSVRSIINDSPGNESYSLALASHGEYGVDEGLIFSFPCRTENGTVKVIENISHNEFGQQKIKETLKELREEQAAVKALGLI